MPVPDEIERILDVAATAISPYNTQPWRFRISDRGLEVYIIRTKNFFLKLQGVSHMTLGCLLENLAEGARHHGYRCEYEFLGGPLGLDDPCAVVHFTHQAGDHEVSHVIGRTTNRRPYRPEPLPAAIRDMVLAIADDPNIDVDYSDGERLARLARILTHLESVRLANFKLVSEALEYVRFSAAEMASRPDGLDLRTLEFDPRVERLLEPIQRRRVHRLLRILGVVRIAARRHRDQLLSSGAILTYAIADKTPASFVRLGGVIQRTLNELSRVGVQSMSVLSGLYLLDVLKSNPEIFSRGETRGLVRARRSLEEFFARPERDIVYIVRIGLGEPPAVRQVRRPVGDLLLPTRSAEG